MQHLQQQYCHCWKHFSKSSFGMGVRPAVMLCWISSDAKQWPLTPILSLWKGQKLHTVRSGEYGGCQMVWIWVFTKNFCNVRDMWQGTVIVHIQLFLHCFFFQKCFQIIQMGWSLYLLPVTSPHTHLMSWLCQLWPNFYSSLTLLACHCTPNSLVILDCF